jgi:hypothetical protein
MVMRSFSTGVFPCGFSSRFHEKDEVVKESGKIQSEAMNNPLIIPVEVGFC